MESHAGKGPVLLRDVLSKTMDDIRGRMRMQKVLKSRAELGRRRRSRIVTGNRGPGRNSPAAVQDRHLVIAVQGGPCRRRSIAVTGSRGPGRQ